LALIYSFISELLSHENVTFNENGTLSTIPHHPLEWREDLSGGRMEDDIFYLPNIALLVSLKNLIDIGKLRRKHMQYRQNNFKDMQIFWEYP
jgi:hypothetical protein